MDDCPGYTSIGGPYEGETVECELPIEHNAEGTWHEAHWSNDVQETSVRWAPNEPTICTWPEPQSGFEARAAMARMARMALHANQVFDRLIPTGPLSTGASVQFRKWAPLSMSSGDVLE